MLGLIFVRVICSNLWVICALIFSQVLWCVSGDLLCGLSQRLAEAVPALQVWSPPCHWWEGTVTSQGWLGGPAEWLFQCPGDGHSQLSLLLCTGEREPGQPGFWVGFFVELWCCTCCSPDSFFCQVSNSVYGFISGSLINYQYSLHT